MNHGVNWRMKRRWCARVKCARLCFCSFSLAVVTWSVLKEWDKNTEDCADSCQQSLGIRYFFYNASCWGCGDYTLSTTLYKGGTRNKESQEKWKHRNGERRNENWYTLSLKIPHVGTLYNGGTRNKEKEEIWKQNEIVEKGAQINIRYFFYNASS